MFESLVSLFGGLGIFLFGMKLMSESMQEVTGDRLRGLLETVTKNRFKGILSGIGLTTMVQSSSATTVMVVGFVNAGLLSLKQAIGVIMGANIGTTITVWMVVLFGFKVKIANFALPAIAIGVAMFFVGRDKWKGWGSTLIGFGFLFLGLQFLKAAVPDSAKADETFLWLSDYSNLGFLTTIIFVAIGTLLTVVIQSSSATSALTVTLAFNGIISYEAAIAMILGENIGTTVTANIAALAGNRNSKKAALAHTLFNLLGVAWVLLLLGPVVALVDMMWPGDPLIDKTSTLYHISLFHTTFNVLNTMLLVWFAKPIATVVSRTVDYFSRDAEETEELRLLSAGSVGTSPIAMAQISAYTHRIVETLKGSFKNIEYVVTRQYDSGRIKMMMAHESELDDFKYETLAYLREVQQSGLSGESVSELVAVSDRVKAIEEIGDYIEKIAIKLEKAKEDRVKLTKKNRSLLKKQVAVIQAHYDLLLKAGNEYHDPGLQVKSKEYRRACKTLRNDLQRKVQKGKSSKKAGMKQTLLVLDLSRYVDSISSSLNMVVFAGESERLDYV